jgi:hypothetical protein
MKFRIQHCSFKIRVSDADEDGGVPVGGWWIGGGAAVAGNE